MRRKGSSFLQNGQGIFIKIPLHVYFSCTFWQRVTACSKALYKISYLTWLLKVWNVPSTTILQTTVSTCLSSSAFWSPLSICFILFLRFSLASVIDKLRIQKFSGMNLDLVYFQSKAKLIQSWLSHSYIPAPGKVRLLFGSLRCFYVFWLVERTTYFLTNSRAPVLRTFWEGTSGKKRGLISEQRRCQFSSSLLFYCFSHRSSVWGVWRERDTQASEGLEGAWRGRDAEKEPDQ